jgi:Response regulator containing a CheY-like receiver domain and an HTH DNA-binding domain
MKNKAKILLCEASEMLSSGLALIINGNPQLCVVEKTDNPEKLTEKITSTNADILIINPVMLGTADNHTIKKILQDFPQLKCVALINTYVDQNNLKQFHETIELYDSKQKIVMKLVELLDESETETHAANENVELSKREIDVLAAVAKGLMNKEISEQLHISIHTVISHRKNISKKTGIKSVSGLTVYALINNLIDETEIYK